MKFKKPPPWLVELFDSLLTQTIGDRRLMFGHPAGFVNGNMFAAVFGDSIIVRLAETDRAALLAHEGAETFDPMGGRPMREYVVLPVAMLEDEEAVRAWMARALAFADELPPKEKKPVKRRAPKKAR